MKVVYISMVREIEEAIERAQNRGRTIDYIELSNQEFYLLKKELIHDGMELCDPTKPLAYMGFPIRLEEKEAPG